MTVPHFLPWKTLPICCLRVSQQCYPSQSTQGPNRQIMTEAFNDVYKYLTNKGFQPKLNVMDNQCSKAVETYIKSTKATIQLVNPDNHRVNAAKRAIQTWEHWLAGMGTLDPTCPIRLWCQFIEKVHVSRVNPKLSAYAILEGQFNFDKTPLAPVGTKSLVLLDPNKRNTWQSHAIDVWYGGPAKQHYRNYHFFIPESKGYRISGSAKFFPQHTKMPALNLATLYNLQHKISSKHCKQCHGHPLT
eukprot:CCRYP_011331-RA/>CCRYP_011331-RA protein AED:0.46 eAED:0.40 QI:0/0/0/1/0/0/2/0/244